jgi:hypothetical protein
VHLPIDPGPTKQWALSRMHNTRQQAALDNVVHWSGIKSARSPDCDECAALQWETKGASGHRSPARTVRRVRDERLNLCHQHAALWKARDRD